MLEPSNINRKCINVLISDTLLRSDPMNVEDEISVEDKVLPVVTESFLSQSPNWPSSSSLTARLRRLITAFQRSYRQEQLKIEAVAKGDRRRRRCEQASKLKEIARQERQQRYTGLTSFYIAHRMQIISRIVIFTEGFLKQMLKFPIGFRPNQPHLCCSLCLSSRWTRREECDFYRVVSTFGVEKVKREPDLPEVGHPEFEWTRFRTFARLDKKTDESLSRYFRCFVAMCRRVCHLRPGHGEGNY